MRAHALALTLIAALAAPVAAEAQTAPAPAATQLFLAPTGRVAPKGDGYVKAVGLGVPFAQGSLTDRLSVGFGMPIFGLGHVAVLTPKFQFQRSAAHATSVGAVELITTEGSGGVAYVAHTAELSSGAVHVAAIVPISRYALDGTVVVMIGAEHPLNDRVTFMTENYVTAGGIPMISGGVRMHGRHLTWDLGLMFQPMNRWTLPIAPMVNVGWKF